MRRRRPTRAASTSGRPAARRRAVRPAAGRRLPSVEHRRRRRRRSPTGVVDASRPRPAPRSRAPRKRGLAVGCEDLGDGAAERARTLVGVDERAAEQPGQPRPTVSCPRPSSRPGRRARAGGRRGSRQQGRRGRRRGCAPARRRSRRRTCGAASSASTSATIVSATTPMAGTAVTSVRSLNDTVSSLVTTSTVRQHRPVEGGQRLHGRPGHEHLAGGHAALDAAGQGRLPAVAPRRRRPSGSGRGPREPRRPATSKPSPISTPLTAWMLISARASSGVELAVPVHVAAEPDGHAVGEHLDDAAEASRRPWPPP